LTSGALPNNYDGVLPGRDGHHVGLRHHQREVVREHQELDPEHRRARVSRCREDDSWQQMRHGRQAAGKRSFFIEIVANTAIV